MKKLRILSVIFKCVACVTLVIAVYLFLYSLTPGKLLFRVIEGGRVVNYILFMIPLVFASLSVVTKTIAKALEDHLFQVENLINEEKRPQAFPQKKT